MKIGGVDLTRKPREGGGSQLVDDRAQTVELHLELGATPQAPTVATSSWRPTSVVLSARATRVVLPARLTSATLRSRTTVVVLPARTTRAVFPTRITSIGDLRWQTSL